MLPPQIPLFPLSRLIFPEEKIFLHIFEERYKEMIRECLNEQKWFGIAFVAENELCEIGCAVAIERVLKQYQNGESDIMVMGIYRFRITNVTDERPFLMADIVPFHEPLRTLNRPNRERLISQHIKYLELTEKTLQLSIYESTKLVSYVVAAQLPLSNPEKQALLQIPEENERVNFLTDYLATLLPDVEAKTQLKKRAQGDGQATDLPYLGK
jgi:uncharacterized protein